ncbi:helix-turn-helix transcriptional regulator [Paenibacillus sp. DLE-14]|uniref:Helix-turn-helix transcriptional regulator n=2 Tax=Paenibacillus lignilyticus TaxID=1172615 RepID=A0ABS5C9U9_9BACL|nr:helix-turn-helix transcriptional regulator [Paenibacillus lignilyticus]
MICWNYFSVKCNSSIRSAATIGCRLCYNEGHNNLWLVEQLDDKLTIETCDDSCSGTQMDFKTVKENLVDESAANAMADLFKTLGDPTRVKIIHALSQSELCVHDLTQVLDMGQSAISHQLRFLRNLRIVKRRKVGKTVFYSLDDDHVEQIFIQTLQHLRHD